jgi:hypothetical protein
MRITAHFAKSGRVTVLLVAIAALAVGAVLVDPAAAQLVNPGYDSGPTGFVGNFGTVVGPPFSGGFWGAEDADIVTGTPCVSPRSNPYLLQLNLGGGSYSQAWQAVDVSSGAPASITLSAWFNTCSPGAGAIVGVAFRTFNSANGWPTHTLYLSAQTALDADSQTWEKVSLECALIPADTKWILAEVFQANATAIIPSAVDDVELLFDPHCPVPTQPTTWGAVKSLYK